MLRKKHIMMKIYQVEKLPDDDQRLIKRGLCPWCLVRLVENGKNDCCPDCADEFVGKITVED
jgi:hypothetical protein